MKKSKKIFGLIVFLLFAFLISSCNKKGSYEVTFDSQGGSDVSSILDIKKGSEIEKPIDPEKRGFEFKGWYKDIDYINEWIFESDIVTNNITLYAKWMAKKYTITFDSAGGDDISPLTLDYDSDVVIDTPNRVGYTFKGWDMEVPSKMPAENITLTAVWEINEYTINFKDDDGNILDTQLIKHGEIPVYKGETPTKNPTTKYSYIFVGWTKELEEANGPKDYIVVFEEITNKYTITFKDEEGNILDSEELEYGKLPIYEGVVPTKDPTPKYSYTFVGWTPKLEEVDGPKDYIVVFEEKINKYTITFKDEEDNILDRKEIEYGEFPIYEGVVPTKDPTPEYSYTFIGWMPELTEVTKNQEYLALFEKTTNKYTITFIDEEDNILDSQILEYGKLPIYEGVVPTKDSTPEYSYTFIGWTPELTEVSENKEYVVLFETTTNKYTITFIDEDGSILDSKLVEYGKMPLYDKEDPTKESTPKYSYIFVGWTPKLELVVYDKEYMVVFEEIINKYTITFKNYDGIILQSQLLEYGSMPVYQDSPPTRASTEESDYVFIGWNPNIKEVVSDEVYFALFQEIIKFPSYYSKAEDFDFEGEEDGEFIYIGDDDYVIIPEYIKGVKVTKTSSNNGQYYLFSKRTNIKGVAFEVPGNIADMSYLFCKVESQNIELKYLDTSSVINMNYMFKDNDALTLDLSKFDTSNVVSMLGMFYNAKATTLDLKNFNTKKVTDMRYMFSGSEATTIDLSNFDTSNVTEMHYMFTSSKALDLDLSSFDTSKVTSMGFMFAYTEATTINVSSFNTSNVYDMSYMFSNSKIENIDVSSFNTKNVLYMELMFSKVVALNLDVSNFNTSKVINMSHMFEGTHSNILDLSSFNTSKVTNMSGMFYNAKAEVIDVSSFNTSMVTDMMEMFYGVKLSIIDLSNFNTSNVTNMCGMFQNVETSFLNLSSFDTSNVRDMISMFSKTKVKVLDLSSFDLSKLSYSIGMFSQCGAVVGLARTEEDAAKLNSSTTNRPQTLSFSVKDFEEDYYVISFNSDGGSDVDDIVELSNTDITSPDDPTKEGYTFVGWNPEFPEKMPEENLTLTAIWKANQYTISFDSCGGTEVLPITADYKSEIIAPKDPTKEFYVFVGWSPLFPEKMPLGDITLTAIWEVVSSFYLGKYPQTVVDDVNLINNLNLLTETNDNGYYEYEGFEYAKLIANPFTSGQRFSNNQLIIENNIHYFKVEPIKWLVLEDVDGVITLITELIIDREQFYINKDERIINGETIYANNYKYSYIREWLNSTFYNKVFSAEEKELILTTFVNNSASTTSREDNYYVCDDTYDKVYLLNYQDAYTKYFNHVDQRKIYATDYAKAKHIHISFGWSYWWLRSPYHERATSASLVTNVGSVGTGYIDRDDCGVRPVIKIVIKNND